MGRQGEREREQQINGVRDRALVRNRNGEGWKWPLVKKGCLSIQIDQIDKTNKMSFKWDIRSWVEFFLSLCYGFHSLHDASHKSRALSKEG